MPVEMYLKLDGVTGGTRNFTFKGCADVTSWGWEMESNRSTSQRAEGDKTAYRQISIIKRMGIDSPEIMSLYVQGKTIPFADLTVIPVVSKREAKQKYLSIHMEDVMVKSIVTGGNATEEFFNETIILLFGRIKLEFSINPTLGSDVVAADYAFEWDINQNRPLQ